MPALVNATGAGLFSLATRRAPGTSMARPDGPVRCGTGLLRLPKKAPASSLAGHVDGVVRPDHFAVRLFLVLDVLDVEGQCLDGTVG